MDLDTLKRANEIEAEIALIKKNIRDVKERVFYDEKFRTNARLLIESNGYSEGILSDFLAIPIKELMNIYFSRANERINKLEKEFVAL